MNRTESKYYVYSLSGLLVNRINFKDMADKYGEPIACSQNGLNFIMKRKVDREHIHNVAHEMRLIE